MRSDDHTLDEIIDRVTVDTYGDEGHWSFAQAFEDEIDFPLDASLAGIDVQALRVDVDDQRQELVALIERSQQTYRVSLLDLSVPDGPAKPLINAYRRWRGIT